MLTNLVNKVKNAFQRALDTEHANDTRLGIPSANEAARLRRVNAMANMTGTHGFRVPALSPKADSQGKTRGQRKRELRVATAAKVSEEREPQFMHSAARRRAGHDATPRPMTGFSMQVAA